MKKKKIIHIVEAFGGGVFTYLVELANSMADEFDIVIAYSKRKQTPDDFKMYFDERIKLVEIKNFTRSINPSKDLRACAEIRKLIKEEQPDIVHIHSSKAGIIGRLIITSKDKKLFYTPHGYSFLKQDDSKMKRLVYKAIEKTTATLNKNCKIVACSKGEYKESLKLSKNSTYINNGVNTREIDEFIETKQEYKTDVNNLKICTIGRIGYQKNPELFNQIAEKFPNIQFTWIGDGELRQNLKSSNIKVTGWKNRKDVLSELEKNDIFILPSLWEGLPLALLEAMYLKKVCIVSNVIGNRDVIENDQNGFVCNNLADYVNTIKHIQNGNCNLAFIGNNANRDILDEYNVSIMSKKYEQLYIK